MACCITGARHGHDTRRGEIRYTIGMNILRTLYPALLLSLAAACAMAAATPANPPRAPAQPADAPLATDPQETPAAAAIVEEPVRGKLLYENHCQVCHASVVHVRAKRRAGSIADLHQWVGRWAHELKLPWGSEEIGEVVDYLNDTYYHFELTDISPKKPNKK